MSENGDELREDQDVLAFVKELAKYYLDFLETDFHRGKKPKRKIRYRDDNLRVGSNLDRYPRFESRVRTLIKNAFSGNHLDVKRGAYVATIPENSLRGLRKTLINVSKSRLAEAKRLSLGRCKKILEDKSIVDKSIRCLEAVSATLEEELVAPFLEGCQEILSGLGGWGIDEQDSLRSELTAALVENTKLPIERIEDSAESEDLVAVLDAIGASLSEGTVGGTIESFFDQFEVSDLFDELLELERNRSILDKKEIYLYFYDISYEGTKFPIFYIPATVDRDGETAEISFGGQVFINKRAIEFASDEYKKHTGRRGSIAGLASRIIYLAEGRDTFVETTRAILESTAEFFGLESVFVVDDETVSRSVGNSPVRLSNSCYFSLFDKSDEAIVNDYEEILGLEEDHALVGSFAGMVQSFVNEDPVSYIETVEDEWDSLSVPEKLVARSPIPLNSEQLKIMKAIEREGCNYIVVEGPPGTGKSHTITAVVFNAVLRNQSVLVLSDKKEALDVVEEKITDTMNRVRFSDTGEFQNPILRLGKAGNTYSKILSKGQMSDIRNHHRAVKREIARSGGLETVIGEKIGAVRERIQAEIQEMSLIRLGDIEELFRLEEALPELWQGVAEATEGALVVRGNPDLVSLYYGLARIVDSARETRKAFPVSVSMLEVFKDVRQTGLERLCGLLDEYDQITSPRFGHFRKSRQIHQWDLDFAELLPEVDIAVPHQRIDELIGMLSLLESISETDDEKEILEQFSQVEQAVLFRKLLIDSHGSLTYLDDSVRSIKKYLEMKDQIERIFSNAPPSGYYPLELDTIEDLVTTEVTSILDGKVINFYDSHKNDAMTLREIIRKKNKFPREQFDQLKEAFPCILAGIRDYAEFIPLVPDLFDLLVIDEASQVSIAQALPAILRAKKVLVFGDKKQFSNVKSYHASNEVNRERVNRLEDAFRRHISVRQAQLERFLKFDIRTSVLEFFEFISNFDIQLLKHFRGYKELVSFSNKNFYQNRLQVMKIRGKSIDEVLNFSIVDHDGKTETIPNTNVLEAEFIIAELEKLSHEEDGITVGIITPHTNQQKLLLEMISRHPNSEKFFKDMRLKIMTFDTCQGDEKDIIFYSMVATREDDKLRHVFVRDLREIDLETEKKIMAQRLNVGFSRSKESMHFVLSKPASEFAGAVGDAIRHYAQTKEDALREKNITDVDPRSPMEQQVLNWFYQTAFWKENQGAVEIEPQFEIGRYLKQLDPSYNYPEYKVDFLLRYVDKTLHEHKVIIEYDGFMEHFGGNAAVNASNYSEYLTADDIYRQKILEGYGYRFLRLNKFVLGDNVIVSLDQLLEEAIRDDGGQRDKVGTNPVLEDVEKVVKGLQDGDMKECPKCGQVRTLDHFRDSTLITGYGRICNVCKQKPRSVRSSVASKRPARSSNRATSSRVCPICGARMVRRTGPYGSFYGCSRYPRCRATSK